MSIVSTVSEQLLRIKSASPLVIGLNGVDGAGKTEFVKRLKAKLQKDSVRQVESVSIDGFHNPREVRYAKGRRSAEGFYRDSFNLEAFEKEVLKTLASSKPQFTPAIFDVKTNTPVDIDPIAVAPDAIILVEGIFLFQDTLIPYFDVTIFLDAPFEVTFERMLVRDANSIESQQEDQQLFEERYKAGQLFYLHEFTPKERADVVIDNSNFNDPKVVKNML
jgi:uridine kinase